MGSVIKLGSVSIEQAADEAARVLAGGGIVIYPTDTLYGIGCLSTIDASLTRLYEVKGRPHQMPLPVMIAHLDDLAGLAINIPQEAWKLITTFWPGALTVVLPVRKGVSKLLLGGGDSIGIRMPDSVLCREMVKRAGNPIVTTSANRSGELPICSPDELSADIARGVDLIIDDGEAKGVDASSVIDFSGGRAILLREGRIAFGDLQNALPNLERKG